MSKDTQGVLVRNGADEGQVRAAEKREAVGRDKELEDLRFVLSSAQGRRVLRKYLEASGMFRTSYSDSINHVLFLEGHRNMGLMMLTDINASDSSAYVKMMNEAKEGK